MAYTTIDNSVLHFQTKAYTGDGNDDRNIVFDVTDTSNCKFYWEVSSVATNNYIYGANSSGDGIIGTTCIITRLGDT